MKTVSTFLAVIYSYATIIQGECTKFQETTGAVPQSLQNSIAHTYRVSPGIACGKPGLTPQYYGLGGDDEPTDRELERYCPGPGGCPIYGVGSVRLTAFTSLKADQLENIDETDVLGLAIRYAPGLNSTDTHDYALELEGEAGSGNYPSCLDEGESGWLTWTPNYKCVTGRLGGCGGRQKAADSMEVSVCLPSTLAGSFPPIIAGSRRLHRTSAQNAANKKSNPRLGGPTLPSAATRTNTHAMLRALAVIVALALAY